MKRKQERKGARSRELANNRPNSVTVAMLKRKAQRGDAMAQLSLAARFATGDDVKKDPKRAIYWYRKAAAASSPDGLYNLALMYLFGEGAPKDTNRAVRMLRRAADLGSVDACLVLAEAHEAEDLGLMQDYLKSAEYFLKASRLGAVTGIRRLGDLIAEKKVKSGELSNLMRTFKL
jgi:uncharacterized protein